MTNRDIQQRIGEINALLEVKQAELAQRTNRRKELERKQTAKQEFIARIKQDIKAMTDEISGLKTELWGLREINLPEADVW